MVKAVKVVVYGGNGFVGSTIMKRLVERGVRAVSVSRSGQVPSQLTNEQWTQKAEWKEGDAFSPNFLEDAAAVIVSVGSPPIPFVEYRKQLRANGETNESILRAAKEAKVSRAVLINATMPAWIPRGYRDGKLLAEQAAFDFVRDRDDPCAAAVLKPSAIYGTRYENGFPIPLTPILAPLSWVLSTGKPLASRASNLFPYLFEGALVPPVPVTAVACAAVSAALDGDLQSPDITLRNGEVTTVGPFELLSSDYAGK
mmetsp:Transcript_3249/g.4502  ORF Transcript_3249/g.4502 Transcript_3249/m.4502 type:complete len:256 (-) Transcript_3249:39-806(-)